MLGAVLATVNKDQPMWMCVTAVAGTAGAVVGEAIFQQLAARLVNMAAAAAQAKVGQAAPAAMVLF